MQERTNEQGLETVTPRAHIRRLTCRRQNAAETSISSRKQCAKPLKSSRGASQSAETTENGHVVDEVEMTLNGHSNLAEVSPSARLSHHCPRLKSCIYTK